MATGRRHMATNRLRHRGWTLAVGALFTICLTGASVAAAVKLQAQTNSSARRAAQLGALPTATPINFANRALPRRRRNAGQEFQSRALAEQLLERIATQYGGQALSRASIGEEPPGWTWVEDPSVPTPGRLANGLWLYTTVRVPADDHSAVRPVWEANLVAGALRDLLFVNGITRDLAASRITLVLPTGEVLPGDRGGVGLVVRGQAFSDGSPSAVHNTITARASALGLDVVSVEILHALQSAPSLVVRTSDVQGFMERRDQITASLFGPRTYEGYHIRAETPDGHPFFIQAVSFRIGSGQMWLRPDLDTRETALKNALAKGRRP